MVNLWIESGNGNGGMEPVFVENLLIWPRAFIYYLT